MYHKVNLSIKERINAWLDLNTFTYQMMHDNLGKKKFNERLKRIREEQLNSKLAVLVKLKRLDK